MSISLGFKVIDLANEFEFTCIRPKLILENAMTGQDPETPPVEKIETSPDSSPESREEFPQRPIDPTRYGDWEKNGRCIDF